MLTVAARRRRAGFNLDRNLFLGSRTEEAAEGSGIHREFWKQLSATKRPQQSSVRYQGSPLSSPSLAEVVVTSALVHVTTQRPRSGRRWVGKLLRRSEGKVEKGRKDKRGMKVSAVVQHRGR